MLENLSRLTTGQPPPPSLHSVTSHHMLTCAPQMLFPWTTLYFTYLRFKTHCTYALSSDTIDTADTAPARPYFSRAVMESGVRFRSLFQIISIFFEKRLEGIARVLTSCSP